MKKNEAGSVFDALLSTKLFRIMKMTLLLLTLACLQVSANGYSQEKITLRMKTSEIKRVLFAIEKNSGYRFLFDEEVIKGKPKVSVAVENAPIDVVLSEIFSNTGIKYKILNTNLVVLKETPAVTDILVREVRVAGKVTSSTGTPLPGVSVTIKGSSVGTTTDAEGNYAITVPDDATLEFSYVGYVNVEEKVAGRTVINVSMQSAEKTMDAVVVIGYGTQRKKDLTGSIASVSGDEIAKSPNTNPVSSLQGKVAGLTVTNSGIPGAAPTIRIRGVNSTNSATPLYVVDGVLHDNIDFLNPADIESVDVLRDPSSIAIYGLRGANGVIAITSKRAARGATRVNVQSSVGFSQVQKKIDVTDAEGFKKLYSAQLANTGADPFDYTNYTANTNWQDLILRKAIITNQSVSVSNSGEKTTTYLNIGYNKHQGVVKYGDYDRLTIRLNEEIRITDNIKVGGDLVGTYWKTNPSSVSLTNALWAAPIVPVQAEEDLYYSMPSFQRAQVGNPIAALNRGNRTSISRGYRFVGSIFAEIKLMRSLTLKSVLYTDLGFNNNRGYSPLPFRFIELGEMGGETRITYDDRQFTSVNQSQQEFRKFQQDHTITWDKRFDGGHNLTAMAGFTTSYTDNTGISASRRDTTLNIPDDPNFWYINIANMNNPGNYSGSGGKEAIVGSFGRVNYSFRNRYLVNATIRRDGSSKFAPSNRWGSFGSVGLGWVISEEDFFTVGKKINFLKLRTAWGKIGNSNGVPDRLFEPGVSNAGTAIFGDNVYSSVQAAYIPDPNVRWEVVRGFDVGVDLRAYDNRLNAEINFYDRTTTGILTRLEIPNDTRTYFTNLGKITNRGVEVTAGWNDKMNNGLTYGISANFSYNKNIVNSIGDKIDFQIIGNSGANRTITGYSIGHFFGYIQEGIYQSASHMGGLPYHANALPGDIRFADIDGNDTINTNDRTYLGTPFPPYSFGMAINLGYKGFDLMIEGQGFSGNKIYTQRRTSNFATLNYEANRLNAWTAPGTSNVEPILDATRGNNYLLSTYFLEPGDYFRLRTVQLGYSFNPNVIKKAFIKQARVYISGQNVATWTKVTGYSPEAPIGSITGGGADNGIYPVPATYTFGVNLTF